MSLHLPDVVEAEAHGSTRGVSLDLGMLLGQVADCRRRYSVGELMLLFYSFLF